MNIDINKAILLHMDYHQNCLLGSYHDVVMENDQPVIAEGTLLTAEGIQNVMRRMAGIKPKTRTQWIPDNVLAMGSDSMVWFKPACIRTMYFKIESKPMKFLVPWPSLLFKVQNRKISVAALRFKRKPKRGDRIYYAPLMNIYSDHSVCTGTADLPDTTEIDNLEQWESVIYDTYFTHTQSDHPNTLSSQYDKNTGTMQLLRFWKKLKGAKAFPTNALYRTEQTINDWIEQ